MQYVFLSEENKSHKRCLLSAKMATPFSGRQSPMGFETASLLPLTSNLSFDVTYSLS